MVATRRQAYQESATNQPALEAGATLRKKPVRRATAKKAESESKATEPARERTAKITAQEEVQKAEPKAANPPAPAKPTRRAAGRVKEAARPEEREGNRVTSTATQPTRATTARVRARHEHIAEDVVPQQPTEAPTTRKTRATATKAQPLSPKKITQISRPPPRAAKGVDNKAKSVAQPVALGVRTRTRKRTVSDENADLPDIAANDHLHNTEEIVAHSTTPIKRVSPAKRSPQKAMELDSEASMSSKETTPSASPAPSFGRMEDDHEYRRPPDVDNAESEHGEDLDPDNGEAESDDELCGPKTPMRRASPSAQARYLASIQRTIQRANEPTHSRSPARVSINLASPVLGAFDHDQSPCDTDHRTLSGANCITDDAQEDSIEVGSYKDEDISEDASGEKISPNARLAFGENVDGVDHEATDSDPEATVLMDSASHKAVESESEGDTSSETEETILITRDSSNANSAWAMSLSESIADTAEPETIVWENIRQDFTIPVDFDAHLASSLVVSDVECTDAWDPNEGNRTSDLASSAFPPPDVCEIATPMDGDMTSAPADHAWSSAPDPTLNLSDFIDIGAISEPTQNLQIPDLIPSTSTIPLNKELDHSNSGQAEVHPSATAFQQQTATAETDMLPHYALSTISFDVRRKSFPALECRTPVKNHSRPKTSDGITAPQSARAMGQPGCMLDAAATLHVLQRLRTATVNSAMPAKGLPTISKSSVLVLTPKAPASISPATSNAETPAQPSQSPGTSNKQTRERYPKMPSRNNYEAQSRTAIPASRFHTPAHKQPKRPATVMKPSASAETPRKDSLLPRPGRDVAAQTLTVSQPETAVRDEEENLEAEVVSTPCERFPRLPPQPDYLKHANTAAAARFQTPIQASSRRCATVHREGSLRMVAIKDSTPTVAAQTPIKTPLKPPAVTPARIPMTPHPSAPLRGIVAWVEVYTLEGSNATSAFVALLHRLGAKTTKAWNDRITHVVFKDGSPKTLQRVRMHNKAVDESGAGMHIHCVNSRWVADCDAEGQRMDEADEAYAVDPTDVPRGGKRRRKSMEPLKLVNVDGNIVRSRQTSLSRSSLGSSPLKMDSPPTCDITRQTVATPKADVEKENSEDDLASPATPAYLAAPDKLILQTAPINRMRKLGSKTKDVASMRRLTFFDGAA